MEGNPGLGEMLFLEISVPISVPFQLWHERHVWYENLHKGWQPGNIIFQTQVETGAASATERLQDG